MYDYHLQRGQNGQIIEIKCGKERRNYLSATTSCQPSKLEPQQSTLLCFEREGVRAREEGGASGWGRRKGSVDARGVRGRGWTRRWWLTAADVVDVHTGSVRQRACEGGRGGCVGVWTRGRRWWQRRGSDWRWLEATMVAHDGRSSGCAQGSCQDLEVWASPSPLLYSGRRCCTSNAQHPASPICAQHPPSRLLCSGSHVAVEHPQPSTLRRRLLSSARQTTLQELELDRCLDQSLPCLHGIGVMMVFLSVQATYMEMPWF
ncbi:hypothetical protein CIPAW_15G159300 [Carya illinoinensis]|uniref:Uncharacterized protein n=1 Tax=Carya illinoinensis TaxID=32201 RepID=A0A8T1N813_CARIL|nr:hypothetical protein CIPAW_15G159300 [Carya illinoinensis]